MAFRTRSAVRALTLSEPLMVRETVAVETFACFATSLMFIGVQLDSSSKLYGRCYGSYSLRFGIFMSWISWPDEFG